VSLLWEDGGGEVFAFLRASDPRKALVRQLTEIEPLLADVGSSLTRTSRSRSSSTTQR